MGPVPGSKPNGPTGTQGPQISPGTRISDILQEVPSTDHGTLSNQDFTQEVAALLDVIMN